MANLLLLVRKVLRESRWSSRKRTKQIQKCLLHEECLGIRIPIIGSVRLFQHLERRNRKVDTQEKVPLIDYTSPWNLFVYEFLDFLLLYSSQINTTTFRNSIVITIIEHWGIGRTLSFLWRYLHSFPYGERIFKRDNIFGIIVYFALWKCERENSHEMRTLWRSIWTFSICLTFFSIFSFLFLFSTKSFQFFFENFLRRIYL